MSELNYNALDNWLDQTGPRQNIVISSRVRYARNLRHVAFPPHAALGDLARIAEIVDQSLKEIDGLEGFERYDLDSLSPLERGYLRESRFISREMEHGGQHRRVYINARSNIVMMVNEEDHLRIFCMQPGFQLFPLLTAMNHIDSLLGDRLPIAWHDQFGFLTACPTNTGTGIRGSVMLHLPGLAHSNQIDSLLKTLPKEKMAARGYYGENSEHQGDLYQISNEATLGSSEEDIIRRMIVVIESIVNREQDARAELIAKDRDEMTDKVMRTFGMLRHLHRIGSKDALQLLSQLRFGVEMGLFSSLDHPTLNKLLVQVQPAHTVLGQAVSALKTNNRDLLRAAFLRDTFQGYTSPN